MSRRLRRPARLRQGAVSGSWADSFESEPNHSPLLYRGRCGCDIWRLDTSDLGEAANGTAAIMDAWLAGVIVCV